MSLKEQISSIKLIIQNDRRVLAIVIFLGVAVMLWMFSSSPKRSRPTSTQTYVATEQKTLGGDQAFQDLVRSLGKQVNDVSKSTEDQKTSLERTIKDYQSDRAQFKGIFESVADRLDILDRNLSALEDKLSDLQNQGAGAGSGDNGTLTITPGVERIVNEEPPTPPPPPPPPKPLRILFIAPGDSVPVKLLTGVNAPVDGTPYPTLFQLKGPIAGPDGSTLDLGEARLVAAATGSETDSRALFRLTDLAMRHKDGRRSVVKVDGWVIGEDGIRGMSGRLIDKLGRLILATMGSAFATTLSEQYLDKADDNAQVVVQNSQDVTLDSSDLDLAQASAYSEAAQRITDILIKRYTKLVPVVEVLSGRDVVAVFAAPAEVEVIDEEADEGIYNTALD
ncbi:MAG: hypothetical protein IT292_12445 [Deltaproteobacteria bacterium]|nr:hypothetical protein [Deltaproteobacteria bacterium]